MKSLQELNSLALRTRRLLGEDSYSPIDLFSLVNGWLEMKITLISYPLSESISGMSTRVGKDIIIVINSNSSYGRQRFTLAHELYHVLYEKDFKTIVCEKAISSNKSISEKEADWFASYLLMPQDALFAYKEKVSEWTLDKIIEAEQFFQVSHECMLFRLYMDKLISQRKMEEFKKIPVSNRAVLLGYGKELYSTLSNRNQYFTTGEYIRKVETLSKMDLISTSKREELLMDAFREDMVYGLVEEEFVLND
ncbi:MAG: ImmA/IrrE family metallo-endopeptidase [Erysipelotrichaceae bacterium]|nr:ImmA/IrrE family metallo-endopeptidase [Erysipelotrichaceae bacterium]